MVEFHRLGISLIDDHMTPSKSTPGWVFIWLRHPLRRYVSAFNFTKSIVDFDCGGVDPDQLTLENCPSPIAIRRKIETGRAFDPVYEEIIQEFESANALAESLSSSQPALRRKAQELYRYPKEHMARGIGYHLHNGQWVKRHHKRIFMVGCLESMDADYAKLLEKLNIPKSISPPAGHHRAGSKAYDKSLSPLARRNITAAIEHSDFAALKALAEHGHLSAERLESYLS